MTYLQNNILFKLHTQVHAVYVCILYRFQLILLKPSRVEDTQFDGMNASLLNSLLGGPMLSLLVVKCMFVVVIVTALNQKMYLCIMYWKIHGEHYPNQECTTLLLLI